MGRRDGTRRRAILRIDLGACCEEPPVPHTGSGYASSGSTSSIDNSHAIVNNFEFRHDGSEYALSGDGKSLSDVYG
ncbi:hypothetical protein Nepgr_004922 [Nepenthes gracilis]|uniref:Uncharacterized protein n=1 Tax=Nepenthes gracilis TaxID=150966 RepID=A0AAD3S262_NEPGR|nr:hypothetical protein Nepgr_004922 [Nepenthes gracilis]